MIITKDVHFCSQLAGTAGRNPNETCCLANVLKMSNIEHFPACGTLHVRERENLRTFPEADFIRAMSYLWCSARWKDATRGEVDGVFDLLTPGEHSRSHRAA